MGGVWGSKCPINSPVSRNQDRRPMMHDARSTTYRHRDGHAWISIQPANHRDVDGYTSKYSDRSGRILDTPARPPVGIGCWCD